MLISKTPNTSIRQQPVSMNPILEKYANLLVNYCVELQPGEKLLVRTTTLAEPLVREVYKKAIAAGGHMEVEFEFREQHRIFYEYGNDEQLSYVPTLLDKALRTFDAYIFIRAPFNLMDEKSSDPSRRKIAKRALGPLYKIYSERTATREMKRNLCQYPTLSSAQNARMSLEEYEEFVYRACGLFEDDPIQVWLNRRHDQQKVVDLLNNKSKVHYKGDGIDISFSTKDRIWINSDGQTNMPSGEVYTSPVEETVNGVVHFSLPALYMGRELEDVTLWVKDGEVYKWEAKGDVEFLDEIFAIKGARRFGEVAIGTNYNIQRHTRNILFDEKIGGTIHMALGQAYYQTGGKNESPIHWDMITDMTNGGAIYADDEKIYENGKFIF
jgi:aminopeptidase